jgi:hypothetical protein
MGIKSQVARTRTQAVAATAFATISAATAGRASAALYNGGFESINNPSPTSQQTFSDWQEVAHSAPAPPGANAALLHAGLAPDSLSAARLPAGSGALVQNDIESVANTWQFDVDLASVDPGGPDNRSFDLLLFFEFNTLGSGGGHSVHLRIVDENADGDADLQAFSRDVNPELGTPTVSQWFTLVSDLPFSTDANGNGELSDPVDTLNAFHLRVAADFANVAGPRYTVTAGTSPPVTANYFQDAVPTPAHNNIDRFAFASNFSAGGYVVDNVSMTSTPEPASGMLVVAAGVLATGRRRTLPKPR